MLYPANPAFPAYSSYSAKAPQHILPKDSGLAKAVNSTKKVLKTAYHAEDDENLVAAMAFSGVWAVLCPAMFTKIGKIKASVYGLLASVLAINLYNSALEMKPFGLPNPNSNQSR